MIDRTPPSQQHKRNTLVVKQCCICNADFQVPVNLAHRYSTCSRPCSTIHRQRLKGGRVYVKCPVCLSSFTMQANDAARGSRHFCSNDCRMIGLNQRPRTKASGLRSTQITRTGYRRGWYWDGFWWRGILEHRWVMEQHLNRPLTGKERIHHINGDRLDNRLSNLKLYASHAEHIRAEHPDLIHNLPGR